MLFGVFTASDRLDSTVLPKKPVQMVVASERVLKLCLQLRWVIQLCRQTRSQTRGSATRTYLVLGVGSGKIPRYFFY